MGSGASTVTSNQAVINLNKHCPNIKEELDKNFNTQIGIRKRPIYDVDDSSGVVRATIMWDTSPMTDYDLKKYNMSTNNREYHDEKLKQEYVRAWDYFEWIFRETTENRDRIAESLRDKRVVEFKPQSSSDGRSAKIAITCTKYNGPDINCFKATRKNYWMTRLNGQVSKIKSSRRNMISKYDSRRLRQISHLFSQDFNTYAA